MGKTKRVKKADEKNTKSPAKPVGYMKNENVILAVVIAVAFGFFAGTAFTVYRTGSRAGSTVNAVAGNDVERMQAALEDETRQNPQNAEAWVQLGNIYFDKESFQKAIFAYEKALELKPGNPDVLTDLGVMYRRSGQPEKAVQKFDEAIAADPNHEVSRFNKGIVLLHDLNDTAGAITAWEQLLDKNPVATTPTGQSLEEVVEHYKTELAKEKQP